MKFLAALTDAQRASLEQTYRTGPDQRQRAQAVLLSARGSTLEQLALAYDVHPETVSGWLDAWREPGRPSQAGPSCSSCRRARRRT